MIIEQFSTKKMEDPAVDDIIDMHFGASTVQVYFYVASPFGMVLNFIFIISLIFHISN